MEKGFIRTGCKPSTMLLKHFLGQEWKLTLGALVAGLLANIATLLFSVSIGKYYQLVIGTDSPRGRIFDVMLFEITSLDTLFYLFGMVIIVHFMTSFTVRYMADLSGERLVKSLRESLFFHQLSKPLHNIQKPAGKQLLRYSGDLGSVKRLVSRGAIGAAKDLLLIVLGFGLLFFLNASLASLIAVVSFTAMFVLLIVNRRLMQGSAAVRGQRSSNLNFVSKRLHTLFTIQLMEREVKETQKFVRRSNKLYQRVKGWLLKENLQKAIVPSFMYSLLLAVMVYGAYLSQLEHEKVEGTTLLIFIMFLLSIIPAFRRLLYAQRHWREGLISLRKVIMQLREESSGNKHFQSPAITSGNLNIRPFTKKMEDGKCLSFPALEAQKGRAGYWKAPTGAGKSQLLLMVAGIVPCPSDSIYVDGDDLSNLDSAQLRSHIGLFTSDAPLLGNTLSGVLGNPRRERLKRAIHLLQQLGMPTPEVDNLKIEIGEGGSLLSAGEVKKVQLVRTLINPKSLMLLDDPFAGLEGSSSRQLHRILNALKKESTVLLVMHTEPEMKEENGEWLFDDTLEKSNASTQLLKETANKKNSHLFNSLCSIE